MEKRRLVIPWLLALGLAGCDLLTSEENGKRPIDPPEQTGTQEPPKPSNPPFAIRVGTQLGYLMTDSSGRAQDVWEKESVFVTLQVTSLGDTGGASGSLPGRISYTVAFQGSHHTLSRDPQDPQPPITRVISGKAHCTTFLAGAPRSQCALDSSLTRLDSLPYFLMRPHFHPSAKAPFTSQGSFQYLSREYPLALEIQSSGGANWFAGSYNASETGWVYKEYSVSVSYNMPLWDTYAFQLIAIDGAPVGLINLPDPIPGIIGSY